MMDDYGRREYERRDESAGRYDRGGDSMYDDRSGNGYRDSRGNDGYGSRGDDHYGSRNDDRYGFRGNDNYDYGRNDGYGSRGDDRYDSRGDDRYGSRSDDHYGSRGNDHYGSRSNDHYGSRGDDHYNSRGDDRYGSRNDRSGYRDNRNSSNNDRYGDRRSHSRGRQDNRFSRGGGGGGERFRGRDSSNFSGGSGYEERQEEEENSWKPILDNPNHAEEMKDDLVSKILGKLRGPVGTKDKERGRRALAHENEVLIQNIPEDMAEYSLQLLLGACGQLEQLEQMDQNDLSAGVIAKYCNISSSYRAVRLLDKLQLKNRCLNVNPYLSRTKQDIFQIQLDWITVTNDDEARRLIRNIIQQENLLPDVTERSKNGYGPWVVVASSIDEQDKAWEYVQLVYIGDQRARWFRRPQRYGVPMQRFVEKDKAKLSEIIAAVEDSVTNTDDCLIISAFIYDFVSFSKSDKLPEDAPEILTMNPDVDLESIIRQVSEAHENLKTTSPHLKTIWLLPHAINFGHYNQIIVSNAGFDINLEEILGSQHEADAKKFQATILELKDMWRSSLKDCCFVYLGEIFFKKGKKADTFLKEEKISWPKNFTIDGLNPAERMTRVLSNVLERWMTHIGVDPITIAEAKNYTKPPKPTDEIVNKTINGEVWKCGETTVPGDKRYGHLDRLDALWTDQENKEKDAPDKKQKTESGVGKESLSLSIDSVKSNIMNILNIHAKMHEKKPEYEFSISACIDSLQDIVKDFGILASSVEAFINILETTEKTTDADCTNLANKDNKIITNTIIDKLRDLETSADSDSKQKYSNSLQLLTELSKRL